MDKTFIDAMYKSIGENDLNQEVTGWLDTGYLPLNKAMSGSYDGGFPRGRLSEVYGPESCGKTLLATMAMISTQRAGGVALFLDHEHAFYLGHALNLGMVDTPGLWFYKQPETAEQGFQIITDGIAQMQKFMPDVPFTVVIDSVASMITKECMATDFGDGNMRTKVSLAAVMSESIPKLVQDISKSQTTLIMLNQTRDNIGVMFGDKKKTAGGNALKYYASLRLQLNKTGKIKDGDSGPIIGEFVKAETKKNKTFMPFQKAQYNSSFTTGIDLETSHIMYAKEVGIIKTAGSYLEWDGKKVYAKALAKSMRDDPAKYAALLDMIRGSEK
jgi:protein RecA